MEFYIGTPSKYSKQYMLATNVPTTLPKGSYFAIVRSGTDIVASGIAEFVYNGYTLRGIEVHPDHRGKGIGTMLVTRMLAYIKPKRREIRLYVDPTNAPAIHVYTRLGFKKRKEKTAFGDKYVHTPSVE